MSKRKWTVEIASEMIRAKFAEKSHAIRSMDLPLGLWQWLKKNKFSFAEAVTLATGEPHTRHRKKWYQNEENLHRDLLDLSKSIGRMPTQSEVQAKLGGGAVKWMKKTGGVSGWADRLGLTSSRKGKFVSLDSHTLDSSFELLVDNLLYRNQILHVPHKPLDGTRFLCDFFLPEKETYVEIWGMFSGGADSVIRNQYREKMKIKKERFYQNKKLIELFPNDFTKFSLDSVIKKFSYHSIDLYFSKEIYHCVPQYNFHLSRCVNHLNKFPKDNLNTLRKKGYHDIIHSIEKCGGINEVKNKMGISTKKRVKWSASKVIEEIEKAKNTYGKLTTTTLQRHYPSLASAAHRYLPSVAASLQ